MPLLGVFIASELFLFRSSKPLFSRQISQHLAAAAAAASSSWSLSLYGRKMSNPTNQGGYSNSTPRGSRSAPESFHPRQIRNRSGYSNPRSSHSPSVPESANSGQFEKNQRSSVSSGVQGSRHSSFRGSSSKQRSHGRGTWRKIETQTECISSAERNVKPNEKLLHLEGSMDQKDGTYSDDCACEDLNRSVEGVPQGVALSESALRQQDNERSDVSSFETQTECISSAERNVKPNEKLLHLEGSMDQKDGTYSDDCACEDMNRSVEGVPQGVTLSESALRQQDNERSDVSSFETQTECISLAERNVKPNEKLLHLEGSMDQKDGTYSDDCACEDMNRSVEGVLQGVALSESALRRQDNERSDVSSFDICCPVEKNGPIKLRPPLHLRNKEKKLSNSQEYLELGPGMILIRKYLKDCDQVEIVSVCRQLGMGPGGFYRPGYSDGAKLRLWMMCLGKNWDPQTSKYDDVRSIDGVKPPAIPDVFKGLVERAIKDCHIYLKKNCREPVEAVLPAMTPDICIVNFYAEKGKLGLHQDRDETQDSLLKGLPVVSFSIGYSADFLYGSDKDPGKAQKVVLGSGDLLIFGGKSRHIFHGVPRIIPNSAPIFLSDETHLRPGRLNLTFRQYK